MLDRIESPDHGRVHPEPCIDCGGSRSAVHNASAFCHACYRTHYNRWRNRCRDAVQREATERARVEALVERHRFRIRRLFLEREGLTGELAPPPVREHQPKEERACVACLAVFVVNPNIQGAMRRCSPCAARRRAEQKRGYKLQGHQGSRVPSMEASHG